MPPSRDRRCRGVWLRLRETAERLGRAVDNLRTEQITSLSGDETKYRHGKLYSRLCAEGRTRYAKVGGVRHRTGRSCREVTPARRLSAIWQSEQSVVSLLVSFKTDVCGRVRPSNIGPYRSALRLSREFVSRAEPRVLGLDLVST